MTRVPLLFLVRFLSRKGLEIFTLSPAPDPIPYPQTTEASLSSSSSSSSSWPFPQAHCLPFPSRRRFLAFFVSSLVPTLPLLSRKQALKARPLPDSHPLYKFQGSWLVGRCSDMPFILPSLPKPRFRPQFGPGIDSLSVSGSRRRRVRCGLIAKIAPLAVSVPAGICCGASVKIESFGLFEGSRTRVCGRRKKRKEAADAFEAGKRSANVEAEIYEFMQNSAKPTDFPTKLELVAAGRADLVEAVVAQGGWLAFGWDLDDNEVEFPIDDGVTVTVLPSKSEAAEDGRVYQERVSNGSDDCPSTPSSSGRTLETAEQEEGGGVEGILSRLKKERNLSLITSGKVVNGLDSYTKPIVDRDGTRNTRSKSSESQMVEANNTKFKVVNGTKGAFPDTWRNWSLQRAGFSLTDFEAAEIVPNDDGRLSEEHCLDVEASSNEFHKQAQNNMSYKGRDEMVVDKSKILARLQLLEEDLNSAAHILQARVNGATSQKHQENSLDELHSLSDVWEFQETEIMKARDKLRSIRAKLTVIDGKLSLEIREAQKIAEEKQSSITAAQMALSLLRTTCIVWPNSASEVLLVGSFDGWANQRRMERSNSGIFSLQLKLYPGRYEIKFIVDGVWKIDPLRPTAHNNGHENNLLMVD
ncbi:protein PTST homolog 2, chloroplastic-like [Zingiber officinale]|uniref:protein PTST homolog 2, chloroplastic-like n=1 Tax=Zingiber officinale TaxID=94328 RepID=UPI001C4A9600|nr:protein PTST homolog 2, chloroplastic-like [Zingiber officinale]